MITNCELPLQLLLTKNLELNDFDFVLFHLYQENEEYRNYYLKMRQEHPERMMIFDNSGYEFYVQGRTLDTAAFVQSILQLQPDYYILPDVLGNKEATLSAVEEFFANYSVPCSKPMYVPQGNSNEELVECLQEYMEMGAECIGIPFHLPFYTTGYVADDIRFEFYSVYGEETNDIRYAMGRVQWTRDHETLLKKFKHIHFLGSHCPLEKEFYKDYSSMDTGYPVKLGVVEEELEVEKEKPNIIIDDFFNKELSRNQIEMIQQNILKFEKY